MAMTEEHKRILKYLRKLFVENLEIKPVLDALIISDILSYEDEDRIDAKDTTEDKIRELLRLLPRKGDKAFWALHQALEDKPWLQDKMIHHRHRGPSVDSKMVTETQMPTVCATTEQDPSTDRKMVTDSPTSRECAAVERGSRGDDGMQTDTQKFSESTAAAQGLADDCRMNTDQMSHNSWPDEQENRTVLPDLHGIYQHWSVLHTSLKTMAEYEVENNYDMKSHTNGRAYILNNFCYVGTPKPYERQYADIDTTNLSHLVNELGYEPEVHRNLSSQEIKNSLSTFVNGFADIHKSAIVAIMSMGGIHNGSQFILASDGAPVFIKEDIYNTLCDCPSLQKKPKLFFIQTNNPTPQECFFELGIPEVAAMPYLDKERNTDSYVAYACTKGHYSHRTNIPGSWFVQLLCEVLLEEAHKTEFDDMMQMVADTVGRCNQFYDFKTCQIVDDNEHIFRDTSLKKQLYFLPHSASASSIQSHSSEVSLPQWFFA